MGVDKKWLMPAWMEKYRGLINNTGGNPVEELINDDKTTMETNAIRAILCCCVKSQVYLLNSLKKNGLL